MSGQNRLKVHLEFGDVKADFEGDVDQVLESINHFLAQIYPNLQLLRKITFTPDLVRIAESLIGLVEITPEGPILATNVNLSAREVVCLALLGAYVGNKLGRTTKATLSSNDLTKITGKARKTVSNELPRLVSDGLIERTAEGEYRITTLGIRRTEEIINEYKQK